VVPVDLELRVAQADLRLREDPDLLHRAVQVDLKVDQESAADFQADQARAADALADSRVDRLQDTMAADGSRVR